MDSTSAQRVGAGLSLLFAAGERPDSAALGEVVAACQAPAAIAREDRESGVAEIAASGLMFEIDGLAPAPPRRVEGSADRRGSTDKPVPAGLEAVRVYPGHHLSGGVAMAPVIRALLALAAELAVSLPVQAVRWHPADTVMDPHTFSRTTLAWLAGGAFPACGLTALSTLADGSVVSRGLAHFVGQEVTVRGRPEDAERTGRLAAQVVGRIVEAGPLQALTRWTIGGEVFCAEPALAARQILVWPAA
jgi:hypothetical protein